MTKTEDKVNIGKEVRTICTKLGLDGPYTKELHITPTTVTATVYLKNEQGAKHLIPDGAFDMTIATETRSYEVRT